MPLYGLTGSLGAGKSTVGRMLRRLGVPVCDADRLGHKLLAEPGPVQRQVALSFPECVDEQGVPRRQALARVVFSDPAHRRRLERIIHPAVRRAVERWRGEVAGARPAVVEAAVLLESAGSEWRDLAGIVVVVAQPGQLLERALKRAGGDVGDAERRLQQQLPQSRKLLAADYMIENSGDKEATWRQVEWLAASLHREWGGWK